MIEIDHLSKRFGPIVAVDDISFSVAKGEVLGFLGPNGAGKSTTMKMITGFLGPTSGTARVAGFDVRDDPIEVKRRTGYLPEGAPMWPDMTPASLLRFVADIRGFASAEGENRIADAIAKTELGQVLQQPIDTLSKGFKRRVGLAQALLHDPEVLILDEPTDGLDPNQKHQVRELIRTMAGDKAIVISTHILEEVEAVCSRAIIIDRGRIVADTTPDGLMAQSDRHNGISLQVADEAAARSAIEPVAGVAGIDGDGPGRLFVRAAGGAAIAAAVGAALRDKGVVVDEIHVERGRLDDVFRNITTAG
ncbi:MAG: ABC transporter ATP-binding protein [Alphaproteobacteria bacterium]|jgi:ABC-2 type transport system ATP-binding protein|nr:ABC transporter ATP-binding protein [Alphaproteobacteria bacterium]